jgi:hypothetical protein
MSTLENLLDDVCLYYSKINSVQKKYKDNQDINLEQKLKAINLRAVP